MRRSKTRSGHHTRVEGPTGEHVGGQLGGLGPVEEDVPLGEQVAARDEVLDGRDEGLPVAGRHQVGPGAHEHQGLRPGLLRLRQVQVHLVPIKVRVVRRAHALVEAERPVGQHLRERGWLPKSPF